MKRAACVALLTFAWGLLSAGALAPQSPKRLTFEQMMSPQELRASGVATLTRSHRAALDKWLSDYTMRVLQVARRTCADGDYAGIGTGHWIQKNAGGDIIILEDGSTWKVNSIDRIYTSLWLPITEITVLKSRSPVGEYKYLLINTDDGEKALVKYLGN